jgi:hypothetical protein
MDGEGELEMRARADDRRDGGVDWGWTAKADEGLVLSLYRAVVASLLGRAKKL